MNELHLQDKFLVPFIRDELSYREVKANTVTNSLIIEEDLEEFISQSQLNKKPYETLLRKYNRDRRALLKDLIELIQERSASSRNMALFFNTNKSISLQGVRLHLFYTGDSVIHDDALFDENIFSVVQELPYIYEYQGNNIFSIRPDIVFFLNGIYLGYSELKSNYTNQTASRNGRGKVIKDYFEAVRTYHKHFDENNMLIDKEKESYRRDFLKIFERAIHITTTDIGETFVIRTIVDYFDEMIRTCKERRFDREEIEKEAIKIFKPYPLLHLDVSKKDKLKEIFRAHYSKPSVEKEILYYNFIERETYRTKNGKEIRGKQGVLIAPRPKQKFGTDKIMDKIDELLANEHDDDYFQKLLEKQLTGVSEAKKKELLEKRRTYSNNKNVYSLLMQYAAGFGKSNIIGWSALQLKDLRKDGEYIYDKVMIVVDRLQLRGQIDSLMFNMNIDKNMYVEVRNKDTFQEALASDMRIVIVNLQKFGALKEMLDSEVLQKLNKMRIVFLIDEIHRSHRGLQHEQMASIFDELQNPFDTDPRYNKTRTKKNLIIGFTATPDDHTLARFGEFSGYAESEKLWRPFDSYTMKEAIEDGYILNPLKNIIPIASKMLFDLPENLLSGFTEKEYKNAQKKQIYENRDRINAISKYVADLLVKDVYRQIRGTGKAMLAVYSITSAIAYFEAVKRHFNELIKEPKYEKYNEAPIHVIYSSNQDEQSAASLNNGMNEEKVLENFRLKKNGLIIVVAKLQTGFDERKLHTLFLDKEIRNINAIQTISRVNRKTKYKNDCKIIDFSYNNVNVQNIKDAFELYSDVVVSGFDPFHDKSVLDCLFKILRDMGVYTQFYPIFESIYKDKLTRDNPESYLDFEGSLSKYIETHPKQTADAKAKATQYFTILNRIEYVLDLDEKYSEKRFLLFWHKFNVLYNLLHRNEDPKDPIEVYFDNQIGIIEVETEDPKKKKKKPTTIAEGSPPRGSYQYDILSVIEARNEEEAAIGQLIENFRGKIEQFFNYVKNSDEGKRLIVKMRSQVSEAEIYEDFSRIYRTYRIIKRKEAGEYFFKEMDDLVEKLCDDFEKDVVKSS